MNFVGLLFLRTSPPRKSYRVGNKMLQNLPPERTLPRSFWSEFRLCEALHTERARIFATLVVPVEALGVASKIAFASGSITKSSMTR